MTVPRQSRNVSVSRVTPAVSKQLNTGLYLSRKEVHHVCMKDNPSKSVACGTPPEPDKSAKIYFWIGLFVALGALGLPLIGVTVNVWLGGVILAIAFFCIVRAFWIWEKSSRFHILLRLGTIAVAAVLYFGLAGRQIISEYRVDHPKPEATTKLEPSGPQEKSGTTDTVTAIPQHHGTEDSVSTKVAPQKSKQEEPQKSEPTKPSVPTKAIHSPFAVRIESAMLSPHPKIVDSIFWVAYASSNGRILSPAKMAIVLRLTNLKTYPVMIDRYGVKANNVRMIKISGPPTEAFFAGKQNIHALCWINDADMLDKQLAERPLQPGIPVQGMAFFEYPVDSRPESLGDSDLAGMHFTVTISDVQGASFTSMPLQPKFDPWNESVQGRAVHFDRGTRDLSSFTIADFTVPHGLISAPF